MASLFGHPIVDVLSTLIWPRASRSGSRANSRNGRLEKPVTVAFPGGRLKWLLCWLHEWLLDWLLSGIGQHRPA